MKPYQKHELEKRDVQSVSYDECCRTNKGALFHDRECELFIRSLAATPTSLVVDVGAGTGRLSEAVAPHVGHVVAVDLSSESLRILAGKGVASCSRAVTDASALPFKDEAFDSGISCQMFHLLRFDEVVAAIKEIHRILKPGGRFVLSAGNLPYWRYRGVIEYGDAGETYTRPFTEGFVKYLAEKGGLRVEHVGYYKSLPFRKLKSRAWLVVDRLIARVPVARRRLNALMVVVLVKEA